jgi:DNA replication protein DnaD
MDLEQIRQMYVDVLGPLNAIKAQGIERAMKQEIEPSAILDALEQTALAPRPSHAYLMAILRRYAAAGIHTADEAEADRQRFAIERAAASRERSTWYDAPAPTRTERRNPALNYAQREYKAEDYGENFFIDLDKYGGEDGKTA